MKEEKSAEMMYTQHGKKRKQGKLISVAGIKALGYFEGEKVIGYTTLEEINKLSYTRNLPEYQLDF